MASKESQVFYSQSMVQVLAQTGPGSRFQRPFLICAEGHCFISAHLLMEYKEEIGESQEDTAKQEAETGFLCVTFLAVLKLAL